MSLSRELSRNISNDGYCAESAHILATQPRVTARKVDKRHITIIKKGSSLGWFLEKISYRMNIEVTDITLRHTTIYKRISANKMHEGSLYKNLESIA